MIVIFNIKYFVILKSGRLAWMSHTNTMLGIDLPGLLGCPNRDRFQRTYGVTRGYGIGYHMSPHAAAYFQQVAVGVGGQVCEKK